ncbi:MAG: hypothetical protein JWL99_4444 [Streptomyces oryziradicis]|nr:hypothetical protein [Actinacidiphila oryziradicis]
MAPGVPANGQDMSHRHLDPHILDSTIQVAISSFREAYRRIQRVMDWGKLESDLWETKLEKISTDRDRGNWERPGHRPSRL